MVIKSRGDQTGSSKELYYASSPLSISGTFTTAIALSTFIYLLMEFPGLQRHLQKECSHHIGARAPSGEDRKKMPLMEATILEILRYISHVPLNLPHFTIEDTRIGGFHIPKNTQVGVFETFAFLIAF